MIQKQSLPINFAKGLDQKTDPWQVSPDRFLALSNSVFTKTGRLTKRNGFGLLSTGLDSTVSSLETFQDNLTAIGNNFYAYNEDSSTFIDKGSFRPLSLSVTSLIKNNYSQTQCDSATATNGAVCVAYTENQSGSTAYKYAVLNGTTGQILIAPSNILPTSGVVSGSPRVFVLGNNFIVVFTATIGGTARLQYFPIGYNNFSVGPSVNISSAYTPSSTVAFDGYVMNSSLYLAWNSSGGGGILMIRLSSSLTLSAPSNVDAAHASTIMSVTSDGTYVYTSYYDVSTHNGYVVAVDQNLNPLFVPQQWINTVTILAVTSVAISGVVTIYYETNNNYSYDAAIPSHFISRRSCTSAGVLGPAVTIKRSVGLASKAFIIGTTQYVLTAFSSPYQPTYFLLDSSGNIVSQLAYEDGGGYLTLGLPSVSVDYNSTMYTSATGATSALPSTATEGAYAVLVNTSTGGNAFYKFTGGVWLLIPSVASSAYLFKDFISSIATGTTNVNQNANIYFQTGINQANFSIGKVGIYAAEIGQTLNVTGGFLWSYDGSLAFENGFFLFPDSVEATWSAIGGSVVAKPDGATNTNAYFYQAVYEWSDNQGNQYRSTPSIPVAVTTTGSGTAGSITVNVPTLRLSYKTNVKITIYRWSVGQQLYYQTTSITSPTINDPTVDSIAFVDTNADATILGNNLIYTTGGVIEDSSTPSANAITLFDNRVWIIDAENPNVLWYSKQVIQSTPVEMSTLFTLYVSPTQSAQGATGSMRAIAPMDDKLIIFKKDAIYYINGTGPDNTGANSQYSQTVFITSTVGCENPNSIVLSPDGLMFQSDKGIWILKRDLSTEYIGNPVEDYTLNATVTSSENIPATNQVRFTLDSGITLMYDYFFGQWGTFINAGAISGTIYRGLHTLLTPYSNVLQETPGVYIDNASPVVMSFTTAWINLAGLQGYQRAFFFYLIGQYISPHKIQLYISYDYSPGPSQSTLISPTNFAGVYGGPSLNPGDGTDYASPYGQDATFGGSTPVDELAMGSVEQWRVFLAKQKCQSIQISLQEIYDASFGIPPGQGLTLSGINMIYGMKKSYRPIAAANSVGGGSN